MMKRTVSAAALVLAAVLAGTGTFSGCGVHAASETAASASVSETGTASSGSSAAQKAPANASSSAGSTKKASSVSADSTDTETSSSVSAEASSGGTESGSAQIPNPWTETSSLEEAVEGSGVDFTPPIDAALSFYDGLTLQTYLYMDGTIEADYSNGSDTLTIRKSTDTEGQTLSGDYSEYSSTWEYSMKGLPVTCRGDGTRINEATFSVDSYHYAVSCDAGEEGKGITEESLTSLLMGMS